MPRRPRRKNPDYLCISLVAVEGDLAFGCWRCDACDKEIPFASADRMAGQLHELLEDEMKGGVDQQFLAMTSPILGPQHYITLIGKPALSTYLSQKA